MLSEVPLISVVLRTLVAFKMISLGRRNTANFQMGLVPTSVCVELPAILTSCVPLLGWLVRLEMLPEVTLAIEGLRTALALKLLRRIMDAAVDFQARLFSEILPAGATLMIRYLDVNRLDVGTKGVCGTKRLLSADRTITVILSHPPVRS